MRYQELEFSEDLKNPRYLKTLNGQLYTTSEFSVVLKNKFKTVSDYAEWRNSCSAKKVPTEFWGKDEIDLESLEELDKKYIKMPGFSWDFKELFQEFFGKYSENLLVRETILGESYTITLDKDYIPDKKISLIPEFKISCIASPEFMFTMLCHAPEYRKRSFCYPSSHYELKNLNNHCKTGNWGLVTIDFWKEINDDFEIFLKNDIRKDDTHIRKLKLEILAPEIISEYSKIKSQVINTILGEFLIEIIINRYYDGK